MNDAYDEDDLNDGLDDECYPDSENYDRESESPYPLYSTYGPFRGPYYPHWKLPEPEPGISKELLKALLESHKREIALLKKMNNDLRNEKNK